MYKQLIIARKDLNMSPGKLAAQVAHASMAFLINAIKERAILNKDVIGYDAQGEMFFDDIYTCTLAFGKEFYEQWINGSFTKVVCEAKNKGQIEKAVKLAKELDLEEGTDYFLIRDNCLTELEPEDPDGRTLTCIGFMPMESEVVEEISKKFQLYR